MFFVSVKNCTKFCDDRCVEDEDPCFTDCKPLYCQTTPTRTTSPVTIVTPVTPCQIADQRFPVTTIVDAQIPQTTKFIDSSDDTTDAEKETGSYQLMELSSDLWDIDSYAEAPEFNKPNNAPVYILEPSDTMPTMSFPGAGNNVAIVMAEDHTSSKIDEFQMNMLKELLLSQTRSDLGNTPYTIYDYTNSDNVKVVVAVFKAKAGETYDFSVLPGMMYEVKEFSSFESIPEIAGPIITLVPTGTTASVAMCKSTSKFFNGLL